MVLISQSVSGFYKAFGQTFIKDDHFLSFVGAVSSVFNCSGRLFYGVLMDNTCYKLAMTVETVFLSALVAGLTLTPLGGKLIFALAVWTIYFTFPGTYSTQPAVTTQTFGHKVGRPTVSQVLVWRAGFGWADIVDLFPSTAARSTASCSPVTS